MAHSRQNNTPVTVNNSKPLDILVIGAGPAGISCASRAKELNLTAVVVDANTILHTIKQYPKHKTLFGVPGYYGKKWEKFVAGMEKNVLDFGLKVFENTEIKSIKKNSELFVSTTRDGKKFYSKKVVIATGINDNPKKLAVPVKDNKLVKYRLKDASKYKNKKIAIIGGGDCAIEAALQLDECNAKVTLCHRKLKFTGNANPSNIQKLLDSDIKIIFNCDTTQITKKCVHLADKKTGKTTKLPAERVFVFIGKRANSDFLNSIGLELQENSKPECNEKLESNVPGIYVAGDLTDEPLILPAVYHGFKIAGTIKKEINKEAMQESQTAISLPSKTNAVSKKASAATGT